MKGKSLILAVLIIAIILACCKKEKTEPNNQNIVLTTETPGFSIYKTKADYFNCVFVGIDSNENITMTPAYNSNSPFILKDENGNIFYTQRWKLNQGYIVSKEMSFPIAFTSITFQELVEYTDKNGGDIPISWFNSRIVDKNPFTEFYYTKNLNPPREITLGEINKMIEDGTLETVFTRIR
ncbi:MAG: hypothetical protein WCK84_12515 [Bacteroidota bacterium]